MNKDLMYAARKDYETLLEEIAKDVDDSCDALDALHNLIEEQIRITNWAEDVFGSEAKEYNESVLIKLRHVQLYGNAYLDFVQRVFDNTGIAVNLSYREYMHDPGLYEKALKLFSWLICGNRGMDVDYNTFAEFMNKPEH